MAETAKRRRLEKSCRASALSAASEEHRVFPQDPSILATTRDKQNWKGFCEIESEPAFFNVMLREFGVKGVKVEEVVSLDEEILAFLPAPAYGLIFLYKWREESANEREEIFPDTIWFANQTIKDACASVALMNIVNNVPGLELGAHLQAFKTFTTDFNPVMRGEAITNFEFVKKIHNSFARKTDMLIADLQLKQDATPSGRRKRKTRPEEDEAAYHFIAFIPVESKLWKLDGLQPRPQNLGSLGSGDWIRQAKPEIEARMAQYEEEQIEFAILSLVKDPLVSHVAALAANIQSIMALERRLDDVEPNWKDFVAYSTTNDSTLTNGILTAPDPDYELCQATLNEAEILPSIKVLVLSDVPLDIIAGRQELVTGQASLRAAIKEEQQSQRSDEERAASRRHDHGPLVKKILETLKRKKALKSLLA